MVRHRSSASLLAWLYAGLIVYASLYPLVDWRWPTTSPLAFLLLPWPRYWTAFDLVSNLLGYMPLGFLIFTAQVRGGRSAVIVAVHATWMASALSLAMELTQNGLPSRIPSNVDWALNTLGAAGGAALGAMMKTLGLLERWQRLRDRWFVDRSAGALALLLLWPVGLLFPTSVPLGVGQGLARLRDMLASVVADTPLAEWGRTVLAAPTFATDLPPPSVVSTIALGLLAPCLVGYAVSRPGWRRALLAGGVTLAGVGATTLSTALNFGPDHALAWLTDSAAVGLGGGALAALLLAWTPRRAAAALGLMALTALVLLVAQAPLDAYYAQSLHAWEQGRFIRFHGAAQWVGWLWPYAAMAYLLGQVASRNDA